MTYASNTNAVLIDGCNNLQNLSVFLEVTEDISTTDGGGWSLQLNCYPPAGEYCQTSQVNWFQYIVIVQGGNLSYYIQYWANGVGSWPSGYTPAARDVAMAALLASRLRHRSQLREHQRRYVAARFETSNRARNQRLRRRGQSYVYLH
jgi:hypothetical protein